MKILFFMESGLAESNILGLNIITTSVGVAIDIIKDQINERFFKTEKNEKHFVLLLR